MLKPKAINVVANYYQCGCWECEGDLHYEASHFYAVPVTTLFMRNTESMLMDLSY